MTDEEVFTFNRVRHKASYNPHFHVFCLNVGSKKLKTPFFNASISSTYFRKMKFPLNFVDKRKIICLLFYPLKLGIYLVQHKMNQHFMRYYQHPYNLSKFMNSFCVTIYHLNFSLFNYNKFLNFNFSLDWSNKSCNIVPIITISSVSLSQKINSSYSSYRRSGHVTFSVICFVCKTVFSNILQVRKFIIENQNKITIHLYILEVNLT